MNNIRGNIFKMWNKVVYIAKVKDVNIDDYGVEVKQYEKPKMYRFSLAPVDRFYAGTEMALYGEKVTSMYKAIAPIKYLNEIKEGDIAYIGVSPKREKEEEFYGTTGNYIVDSVRVQNLTIAIYFQKIEK